MVRLSRLDPRALAVELLLIVAAREHLWPWLPAELQGAASKGLGAAMALVFLSVIHRLSDALGMRSRALYAVLCLAAWYSLQTLICSAAYLNEPWPIPPGMGMCSARIDFDLGALGIVAIAAITCALTSSVRSDSTQRTK